MTGIVCCAVSMESYAPLDLRIRAKKLEGMGWYRSYI